MSHLKNVHKHHLCNKHVYIFLISFKNWLPANNFIHVFYNYKICFTSFDIYLQAFCHLQIWDENLAKKNIFHQSLGLHAYKLQVCIASLDSTKTCEQTHKLVSKGSLKPTETLYTQTCEFLRN